MFTWAPLPQRRPLRPEAANSVSNAIPGLPAVRVPRVDVGSDSMPPAHRPSVPGRRRRCRVDSQRCNPAALECTPFITSSFSRCTSGTLQIGRERRVQGGGDVLAPCGRPTRPRPPIDGGFRRPRPARPAGRRASRSGPGPDRSDADRRTAAASGGPGSRSKSGGGVDGRSTPASGSFTPTASPANSTPLRVSCSARWCLACPGESTATSDRLEPTRMASPSSSTWIRSAGVGSSRP